MSRFWLVRHAIVEAASRAFLYGRMDVSICDITLATDLASSYRAIATRLPRDAAWLVSPPPAPPAPRTPSSPPATRRFSPPSNPA